MFCVYFREFWLIAVAGSVGRDFDGFGGGVWRFPRSEYMVEVVWIVFVGELERLTASYIRQIRAWAVGQDDVVRRVLMGLRERREEFLCTSTSLRSSGLGLLEDIWSELCLNGEEGEGTGVLEVAREKGRRLSSGVGTKVGIWVGGGGDVSWAKDGCGPGCARSLTRIGAPSDAASSEHIQI